jgi:hypothetical protein
MLLLQLLEVQNLRFADLFEVSVQLLNFLWSLSIQVVVKQSNMQCFYGLSNNLVIGQFQSPCFESVVPSAEICQ